VRRASGYEEASALLARPDPLAALDGEPALLESISKTFGESLTPYQVTERIVADVRSSGDTAIRRYSSLISHIDLDALEVPRSSMVDAAASMAPGLLEAVTLAAARIKAFHEQCMVRTGVQFIDEQLGRVVLPLERVGLYVPGGRFSYPSSVLMSAIPARVAGVHEVIIATPPGAGGAVAPATLAACEIV